MKEIVIEFKMNKDGDILITNTADDEKIAISFNEKKLNAKDVFRLLNYQKGHFYKSASNIDLITEKNKKDYFKEITDLFDNIFENINNLKLDNSSADNNVAD